MRKQTKMFLLRQMEAKWPANKWEMSWCKLWSQMSVTHVILLLYLRVLVWIIHSVYPHPFLFQTSSLAARNRCIWNVFVAPSTLDFSDLLSCDVIARNKRLCPLFILVFSSFCAPALHIADTVNITDATVPALLPSVFSHFLLSPSVLVFIYQSI